jgi:hypothetical protein
MSNTITLPLNLSNLSLRQQLQIFFGLLDGPTEF